MVHTKVCSRNSRKIKKVSRGDTNYLELIASDNNGWIFNKIINQSQKLVPITSKQDMKLQVRADYGERSFMEQRS